MLAALGVLFPAIAPGQDWQFAFDSSGNLTAQTAETGAPPEIIGQPQNQVVAPGESASFSVIAANTRALTYQWLFNGTALAGATTDALLLTNVSAANEGLFSVVVANPSGSVTSAPAALMIDSDSDGLPDSWEQTNFTNLTQTATGDFDGDGVSNRDEFLDATSPTDSASVRFRLTVLTDGGAVEAAPARQSYTNAEVVTLTAVASGSERFRGWTGDVLSRSNSITLTMTNHHTVFAYFNPVIIVWDVQADGNWDAPSNWRPTLVPGDGDTVVIGVNRTITISGPGECANLFLNTGTLSGSGTLTLRGASTWSGGAMSGNGRTIIAPGATLTINNAGLVNLSTRTLDNGGTVLWTGAGTINLSSAVITNRPGALFQAQGAASLGFGGGFSRFDNAGTFRKSSAGTISILNNISFNNYGEVEIQNGTLSLAGGGRHSGDFELAANTTLNLSGSTHVADAASSITGAGRLTVSGATATLAGLVNVSGTNSFGGGTANLTGNYICTNNTLIISAGTANFSGTGAVMPAVVTLGSGGVLGGSSVVTVLNQMTWSGGTMSGSGRTIIPAGVTLAINNAGSVNLNTRTLDNGGTVLWAGAGSINLSSAVITNRPGALFQAQNAASLAFGGGVSRFDNVGTFRKSSAGTISILNNISLNNYGGVEIQAGTLSLSGGGLNNGMMDVPTGTTLQLAGGTFNSSAASSITGAGRLTVSGGAATLAGLVNVSDTHTFSGGTANLTGNYICTNNTLGIVGGTANFSGTGAVMPAVVTLGSGGVLGGSSVVTVLNQMTWSGGTMSGSGRTIIPAGVTLTISNAGSVNLTTRTLDNAGTLLWTGAGTINLSSAVITNRPGALFQAQSAATLSFGGGAPRFDNAGTFRKTGSTGTITVGNNISFNNRNTVEILRGTLAVNGGYNSSPNALLHCAIGGTSPGTGYGRLQVVGTVMLNGALGVELINGFVPSTNDSFTVLTAGTRNGTFANFYYPSHAVSMQLSNTVNSVIVRVTDVLLVPQPTLLYPERLGQDIKLTWTAVSNAIYRVEFNPTLDPSNWNPLPGDVTAVSNSASRLDMGTTSNRFYRVRVVP